MADTRKAAWGGRFVKPMDDFIAEFGASLPVDRAMWRSDIKGSIAHARMLGACHIIPAADSLAIQAGLLEISGELEAGTFVFDNADEDIHMAIERSLTGRIGEAGKRLHTARSRNDQVALDTRMHVKDVLVTLVEAVDTLRVTLLRRAEEHFDVVMPGYTHLQKAQPVLLSHHLLAYTWMLARDATRLRHAYEAADVMPLGSAALAGTTYPIDRAMVASELGFPAITENSLDAVSDRDFLLDAVYACAVGMTHLSRLCEELILWCSDEFGFITMDDGYSTGSSIMPQKKNPDVAELVRGKSGRALGDLQALLVVMKGLPLAYDKDMQEDKEAAFDAFDTFVSSLRAIDGVVGTMMVRADRMRAGAAGGFMLATDLADHLVSQGMAFREAHEVVGRIVLECERGGKTLEQLSLAELQAVSPVFGDDVLAAVDLDAAVSRRVVPGGTGHDVVRTQLASAKAALEADTAWTTAALVQ